MMCLTEDTFKKGVDLLGDEARAALEDKWKNMVTAELELNYKKLELSRELMKPCISFGMTSFGITSSSMAIMAVYYRFSWQMEGGEIPLAEMFGTFALSVGAAVGMEFWARWAHKVLWHDSLWHMHEGLGITMFGMAYMFFHDGLVHRRFPVGPIADVPYLRKVAAAHQLHYTEKLNGVTYGLFLGPRELEEVGGRRNCKKRLKGGSSCRRQSEDHGADIHVIVKIESADSVSNLHSIITASDGAMVARGDLGAELPVEEVPLLQRLKRERERMKEIARWWVDVVRDVDDEENHNAAAAPASQDASDKELEEQVSVKKIGDGLQIKLRCPRGSGYELLISCNLCYEFLVLSLPRTFLYLYAYDLEQSDSDSLYWTVKKLNR
ncbi:hypothetical protein QQ045_011915 [Rhodiola kirilowii]